MAKWALKLVKHAGIGAAAGFVAGGVSSSAGDAPAGRKTGAYAGAAIGGLTGLPFGKIAKGLQAAGQVYGRGLKATPGSKAGKVLQAAENGATKAKVVFRRIRGRIVPIRAK